jgi:hypothetical protein
MVMCDDCPCHNISEDGLMDFCRLGAEMYYRGGYDTRHECSDNCPLVCVAWVSDSGEKKVFTPVTL